MKLEKILKEDRRTKQITYEYILPDYEGTLKRVMMTDAKVMPSEPSLLGSELTLSGVVAFLMLYQTVDDTLENISFEVPYELTFKVDEDADRHIEHVHLASFSCLPSGPRRVVAKGEIVGTLRDVALCEASQLEGDNSVMTLLREKQYHTHLYSKKEEREYAEDIYSCEGDAPTLLYHHATVEILGVHPMKDGATLSGVCHIRALLADAQRVVRCVNGDISFDEFLPMGQTLDADTPLVAEAELCAFSLTVEKEEGISHLVANPTISFFVTATIDNTASFVLDAYCTECDVELLCENIKLEKEYPIVTHRQKLECRLPKNDGDPEPLQSVLFARSEGAVVETTADDGVVYMMLKLSHSLLGSDMHESEESSAEREDADEGKTPRYMRQRAESTHALNIPLCDSRKGFSCHISSFSITSPEIYEEEDAFLLICEVSFALVLSEEILLPVVVDIVKNGACYERQKDVYFVTFPDTGSTLWQIGKENRANISDILAQNPEIESCNNGAYDTVSLSCDSRILLP